MPVTLNGTNGLTFNDGSSQATAAKVGMVNRIINGDMRIDQRNNGASVTPNNQYTLDRWFFQNSQTGKLTTQQSTTAPSGFTNSMSFTSTSAYSVGASDYFMITQPIEGFNVADLGWGTASAQPITLSFWVRSSLTGTFGGAVGNSSATRYYPFSYTISAANTWEQKTLTIAGDTAGTWLTNNGIGILVRFGLGVGSSLSGTAGAWGTVERFSATGATSVVGTSGATFYLTGVQFEKGSTATNFDFRSYGTELMLAQRYYQCWGGTAAYERIACGYAVSTTVSEVFIPRFYVPMRAAPSLSANSVSNFRVSEAGASYTATAISISQASPLSCGIAVTVASGLTTYRAVSMDTNNTTSAQLGLSAEL